jgi:hypothetical protein
VRTLTRQEYVEATGDASVDVEPEGLAEEIQAAVIATIAAEIRERFDDFSEAQRAWLEGEDAADAWLIAWNSKPGRTQAEVLEMLDSAIDRQRARA